MSDQTPAPTPEPTPVPAAEPTPYAQQPTAQPYTQPYAQGTAPAPYNVLAIVSLVVAIVGFAWLSLGAVIMGHLALSQIKKTGQQGRGLALAGTIVGYAGILTTIIIVIFWIIFAVVLASSGAYYYN